MNTSLQLQQVVLQWSKRVTTGYTLQHLSPNTTDLTECVFKWLNAEDQNLFLWREDEGRTNVKQADGSLNFIQLQLKIHVDISTITDKTHNASSLWIVFNPIVSVSILFVVYRFQGEQSAVSKWRTVQSLCPPTSTQLLNSITILCVFVTEQRVEQSLKFFTGSPINNWKQPEQNQINNSATLAINREQCHKRIKSWSEPTTAYYTQS